ncbi:BcpO-related WXXGXW repeat protein [Mucilaginibacter robiniae]|uniref:BcpO-related WXXGXW repeat protein n=1 Tax=Mucilaginibacter robiniae TaxID=2728022 RepID=A0A7L5DUN3_9SPHI|nr:YXWGXW repeat-containing protein [Mucilaginibacter robiniae]QJD94835.1 BcpO-related WXXGXW repeat protein [Mucilaginibacter robiniae]
MKSTLKLLIGLSLVTGLFSSCAGEYYVASRPVAPYYARPVAPYAGAVWVPGEWYYRGGGYAYRNGYWSRPRHGRAYIEGRWEQGPRGHVWRHGYWR